jgi:mitotic spindle assembly checkpoint protein MAD1
MTELVPRASWAAVCQKKAQLKEELRQKEKRILRLRQVFAVKTAKFREALSAILGVKVAFYDNGQVQVTSQYDLGAHLCSSLHRVSLEKELYIEQSRARVSW